ncbi:MAG: choice-of-anchor Q domain-containing protein [Steroidobacteraceae bacterium]
MDQYHATCLGSLLLAATCAISTDSGAATTQTLRAGNANELVNAMIIADKSRQPAVIRLAPGHYDFNRLFSSPYGPSVLPAVTTPIEIIGHGAANTIFQTHLAGRFFTIFRAGSVSLTGVTLSSGTSICSGSKCSTQGGGAAVNVGGILQFHDCVLTENIAFEEEGGPTLGGAILNLDGDLLIERTSIVGNRVIGYGAGIAVTGGQVTMRKSVLSRNEILLIGRGEGFASLGGGLYATEGTHVDITNSTISGNFFIGDDNGDFLMFGSGIWNAGTLSLVSSAVTGNFNSEMSFGDAGDGGGIDNSGVLTVQNSTIGSNTAGTRGGGLFNSGRAELHGVTITGNAEQGNSGDIGSGPAWPPDCGIEHPEQCIHGGSGIWNEPTATLIVADSVISANNGEDCNGTLVTKGRNALQTGPACKVKPSAYLGGKPANDLLNVAVRLGDLQDNGAPGNPHYAPLGDSPLIDTGGSVGPNCTPLDQLGHRRNGQPGHQGVNICDIGAIEFQP